MTDKFPDSRRMRKIAAEVERNYAGDMCMRNPDGSIRPISNIEMYAWMHYRNKNSSLHGGGSITDRPRG